MPTIRINVPESLFYDEEACDRLPPSLAQAEPLLDAFTQRITTLAQQLTIGTGIANTRLLIKGTHIEFTGSAQECNALKRNLLTPDQIEKN